jgi:outer membrane protein assembly factor BamA
VFAAADYRDAPGNPRRGGFYQITAAQWDDRSFGAYDFRRVDAEFGQYVSLRNPRHVVVGHAGISFVNNARGSRVPFYVLPYIGGATTVRSLREFRYRDENALFVSGEYRYGLMKYVQLVGFVDAGKVAHDWQDINLRNMKPGYGGGVRAGTASRTFVRLDVGTGGGDGTHVFVKFFPSF